MAIIAALHTAKADSVPCISFGKGVTFRNETKQLTAEGSGNPQMYSYTDHLGSSTEAVYQASVQMNVGGQQQKISIGFGISSQKNTLAVFVVEYDVYGDGRGQNSSYWLNSQDNCYTSVTAVSISRFWVQHKL